MFSRSLFVIPISLFACNQTNHPSHQYTVYIDPAFGTDGEAEVVDALNDWENAVNSRGLSLHFDVVSLDLTCSDGQEGCDKAITIHPVSMTFIKSMISESENNEEAVGATQYRWYNQVDGAEVEYANSYIGDTLTGEKLTKILRHELGHALSLGHSTPGNIMCFSTSCQPTNISCGDVWQYGFVRDNYSVSCQ